MISLLCPTRGRPSVLHGMLSSALHTCAGPIGACLVVDDDDTDTRVVTDHWIAHPHPRLAYLSVAANTRYAHPMSDLWNICAREALARQPAWPLLFVDDEAMFHTTGWDLKICDALARYPDQVALVHPNDGIHGQQAAGYFATTPTWVQVLGRLTPPMFTYGYADVWCLEVAMALGRCLHLPEVLIENLAPRLQPPDLVHQQNQERAERDRPGDLYLATQAQREQDIAKLRHHIEQHLEGVR